MINSVGQPFPDRSVIDQTRSADLGVSALAVCIVIGGIEALSRPKHVVNR